MYVSYKKVLVWNIADLQGENTLFSRLETYNYLEREDVKQPF